MMLAYFITDTFANDPRPLVNSATRLHESLHDARQERDKLKGELMKDGYTCRFQIYKVERVE